MTRPLAVAFDALQTLLSLEPLRAPLTALGLPPAALEVWYARTLGQGLALTAAGGFAPFRDVAEGVLRAMLAEHARAAEGDGPDAVLGGLAALPPVPDAAAALTRLRDAGVAALVLTNGGRESTRSSLEKGGLAPLIGHVVSIDDVGAWKPRPETYRRAADVAGVEPGRLALVAAHAWDCHGAARAGLVSGYVNRVEGRYNPVFGAPDVRAADLPGVVERLLSMGGAPG